MSSHFNRSYLILLMLLFTHSNDPCWWWESDLPEYGPPASFSVHLASSALTPSGSVHTYRGDNVVCIWVQLKRLCMSYVFVSAIEICISICQPLECLSVYLFNIYMAVEYRFTSCTVLFSPSLIEYVSWTDYGWLPCNCFDHFVNAI